MRRLVVVLGLALAAGGVWLAVTRAPPPPTPPTSRPEPTGGDVEPPAPARADARRTFAPPAAPALAVGRVAGRVVDGLHNPLRGCEVVAQAIDARVTVGAAAAEESALHRTWSAEDGRFELLAPAGVELVLSLAHRDFPPNVHATSLVVARDERRDLGDLVLRSQAGLVVLVRAQEVDAPVVAARLELAPPLDDAMLPGHPLAAARRSAVSDAEGRAVFYGVSPGSWRLRVAAAQRATRELPHEQADGTQDRPPLVVRLPRGVTLRGRVLDGAERPVAGARINAVPGFEAALEGTVTAADGAFRLTGLEPGHYRLEADSPLFGRLTHELHVDEPAEPLELRYTARASLAGIVRDAASGEPVGNASVRVLAPGEDTRGLPRTHTGAQGAFTLAGLPDRELDFQLAAPGYLPRTLKVRPGPVPVAWTLERAGCLRGRIVDPNGTAVAGAQVDLLDAAHDGSAFADFLRRVAAPLLPETRTAEDGTFSLVAPGAGSFRLRVRAAGFPPIATVPHEVSGRGDFDAGMIALPNGGQVLGMVRAAQGAPVAGANVTLDPVPGPAWRSALATRTGADGRFTFAAVAAGEYELSCHRDGTAAAAVASSRAHTRQRVLVEAGRPGVFELRLAAE